MMQSLFTSCLQHKLSKVIEKVKRFTLTHTVQSSSHKLNKLCKLPQKSVKMSLRSRTAGSNITEIELQPAADGALSSDDNRKDKAAFELKKKIGLPGSVALIAGTMVGSGIFASPVGVLVGTNNSVGMSLVLWAACGLIAGLVALCYCELGSAIRESGGEYAYLHKAYVPVITFTFAWTSCVISRNASNAATAVTFGSYVVEPFYPGCQPPDLVVKVKYIVL